MRLFKQILFQSAVDKMVKFQIRVQKPILKRSIISGVKRPEYSKNRIKKLLKPTIGDIDNLIWVLFVSHLQPS